MVKQRFLVLFRRWLFTVAKVFGPILLFEALFWSGNTFSTRPSACWIC